MFQYCWWQLLCNGLFLKFSRNLYKVDAVMLRICVMKTIKLWSNEHGIVQKFCIMMLHEHVLQLVLMTGTWRAMLRHNHVFISLCQYNEQMWHQHLVMVLHLLLHTPRKIKKEKYMPYLMYVSTTIDYYFWVFSSQSINKWSMVWPFDS